jgi:hypothetical protein
VPLLLLGAVARLRTVRLLAALLLFDAKRQWLTRIVQQAVVRRGDRTDPGLCNSLRPER